MIEGRRLLPYYREALSRDRDTVAAYLDCGKCKRNRSREERRRLMSCGFEQPIEGAHAYVHPGYPVEGLGKPTTCIGYTGKLPVVRLADALMVQWERGTLERMLGGPAPEIILETLDEIEWCSRAAEAWGVAERARAAEAKRNAQGRGRR